MIPVLVTPISQQRTKCEPTLVNRGFLGGLYLAGNGNCIACGRGGFWQVRHPVEPVGHSSMPGNFMLFLSAGIPTA
jgi:hypothetical protein